MIPQWLHLKWSAERTDARRRDELRARTSAALRSIDRALAASNGSRPKCIYCQSGAYAAIPRPCPNCNDTGSEPPTGERRSDSEKLAAVQRLLRARRRDHVIVDGSTVVVEHRGATILGIS